MTDTMNALILDADWEPRAAYPLSDAERDTRKAQNSSSTWRHPRLTLSACSTPEVGENEVLVKVRACGVCGSDAHLLETDTDGYVLFSGPSRLPVIIGHEFSGTVVEAGRRVTTLREGDMVASEGILHCGTCEPCRRGNPNQCLNLEMVGFSAPGAFADFIAVPEEHCWKLNDLQRAYPNDDLIYEVGALVEPMGCAYNGMFVSAGGFMPGARVAIFGAGPIGLGAVLLARTAGAAAVMVFDPSIQRCKLALEMGADFAQSPTELLQQGLSPSGVIRELTRGYGADMLVEAAGAAEYTVPEIEKSFAPNGKMVYLGRAGNRVRMDLDVLVSQASLIAGARGHAGHGIYPGILRMLATGRLPAEKMITSRFPFSQVMDAIRKSTERVDGKIMVKFP